MRGRCRCSHLIVDRITLIVVGLVVAFAPLSARAQTAVFVPFASRRDVAHDPVRNLLYIASGSTGTVARYDLGTGQFLTPFNVGGQPVRLDISPDNGRLAVADQLSVSTINGYTSSAAVIDLATGGELIPTSFLTHVVGFALGLHGVRRLGFPRGTWWKATLAFVAVWPVTRLLTPRAANVNLAFFVHPGWERLFPVYALYFFAIVALAAGTFSVVERVLHRFEVAR